MSVNDFTKWRRNGPGRVNCVKCGEQVSTNAFALAKHRCKEKTTLYVLTDGAEIFATREMTLDEALEAQDKANEATAGNVYWIKKSLFNSCATPENN